MFSFQSPRVMCLAGVAGVAIALLPVWAFAADLDRVEVTGKQLRTDVSATCPAIGDQLASNLGAAFSRLDMEGDYRVEFTLHEGKVSQTKAIGGNGWDTRSAIRRAMGRVDCQSAAATPQHFAFLLSVRMEDDGTGQQVARFETKPVTLMASAR